MEGKSAHFLECISRLGEHASSLAKSAISLETYHTDHFLKLKENVCHKGYNVKYPTLIPTQCSAVSLQCSSLTVWFSQKKLWSQIVRSSKNGCTLNRPRTPSDTLWSPERGMRGRHGLRSLMEETKEIKGNMRKKMADRRLTLCFPPSNIKVLYLGGIFIIEFSLQIILSFIF